VLVWVEGEKFKVYLCTCSGYVQRQIQVWTGLTDSVHSSLFITPVLFLAVPMRRILCNQADWSPMRCFQLWLWFTRRAITVLEIYTHPGIASHAVEEGWSSGSSLGFRTRFRECFQIRWAFSAVFLSTLGFRLHVTPRLLLAIVPLGFVLL
jgi:hypothetical protein